MNPNPRNNLLYQRNFVHVDNHLRSWYTIQSQAPQALYFIHKNLYILWLVLRLFNHHRYTGVSCLVACTVIVWCCEGVGLCLLWKPVQKILNKLLLEVFRKIGLVIDSGINFQKGQLLKGQIFREANFLKGQFRGEWISDDQIFRRNQNQKGFKRANFQEDEIQKGQFSEE